MYYVVKEKRREHRESYEFDRYAHIECSAYFEYYQESAVFQSQHRKDDERKHETVALRF